VSDVDDEDSDATAVRSTVDVGSIVELDVEDEDVVDTEGSTDVVDGVGSTATVTTTGPTEMTVSSSSRTIRISTR
jgi:hypothetical protein